jgi:hypothetical protein
MNKDIRTTIGRCTAQLLGPGDQVRILGNWHVLISKELVDMDKFRLTFVPFTTIRDIENARVIFTVSQLEQFDRFEVL